MTGTTPLPSYLRPYAEPGATPARVAESMADPACQRMVDYLFRAGYDEAAATLPYRWHLHSPRSKQLRVSLTTGHIPLAVAQRTVDGMTMPKLFDPALAG
jgi:hypothetical protein